MDVPLCLGLNICPRQPLPAARPDQQHCCCRAPQVIDDTVGRTLAAASTLQKDLMEGVEGTATCVSGAASSSSKHQ
jgi:hypothetical protein